MKRVGKVLAWIAASVIVVLGGAWIAFPPHERLEDGPADPILDVRKPVVRFVRDLGIGSPHFLAADPFLPSRSGAESWEGDARERGSRYEWSVVPVYRGLLWPVGDRLGFTYEIGEGTLEDVAYRLAYVSGGETIVVDEATRANGISADGRAVRLHGYVPRGVYEWVVQVVSKDGTIRNGWTWKGR